MRANQTRRCGDQIGVVPCLRAIRQQRDVLEASPDTMASIQSTLIDCPTRYAVTVVNLLQSDARGHHNVFHLGRLLNSRLRIGIQRLDKDAPTSACQARTHERSRIFRTQQSSLDTNASG